MTPELLADAELLLACCPHAERDFVARKLGVSPDEAHDLLTELAREGRIRYQKGRSAPAFRHGVVHQRVKDDGTHNGHREMLWFSPHCLKPDPLAGTLFGGAP